MFEFEKLKGHQNGEEHVGPWHVYTNPLELHLCVVLSLARYLFSYPELFLNNTTLFQGTAQCTRYAKLLFRYCNLIRSISRVCVWNREIWGRAPVEKE